MHINLLRHGLLVSACCVALCYLILGSLPAAAQFNLPTGCLAPAGQSVPPPNCHVVRVGPPSFQNPFGDTFFFDLDSGRRSDDPAQGGGNPVITVIPKNHTVQWQFFYSHSSTAGTCPSTLCTPNGQWDSSILAGNQPTPTAGNLHTVTFSQPGVFTYFCGVHLSLMRGIVVVLDTVPDYDLFANPDPTIGLAPPTPTASMIAGDSVNFTGVLNSYLGFGSTLTLTCASGTPRNPTGCPPTPPVTVVPMPGATFGTRLFNFPVSENTAGDYTFDIVANPQPSPSPFTHRKTVLLHVNDLSLTNPSPALATIKEGGTAPAITLTAQAANQFSGNVGISCDSIPSGIGCTSNPAGSFPVSPGSPQTVTVTLTNTSSLSAGDYTVNIVATSNKPGGGTFTRTKTFTLRIVRLHATITAPATAVPGTPFTITVAIRDQAGALFTTYDGTVTFSSSGIGATLPANYTFNPLTDGGSHSFSGASGVTANGIGPLVITVRDISNPSLNGSSRIIRVGPTSPGNTVTLTSSRAGVDAFFKNADVTFTATVTSGSGTPTGSVRFFDGTTDIGVRSLTVVNGTTAKATLDLDDFPVGDRLITAVYEATGTLNSNLSPTISQPRSPAPRCKNDVCPGSH